MSRGSWLASAARRCTPEHQDSHKYDRNPESIGDVKAVATPREGQEDRVVLPGSRVDEERPRDDRDHPAYPAPKRRAPQHRDARKDEQRVEAIAYVDAVMRGGSSLWSSRSRRRTVE